MNRGQSSYYVWEIEYPAIICYDCTEKVKENCFFFFFNLSSKIKNGFRIFNTGIYIIIIIILFPFYGATWRYRKCSKRVGMQQKKKKEKGIIQG